MPPLPLCPTLSISSLLILKVYSPMLKPAVQIVVFLMELLMLIAFGCYGYSIPTDMLLRINLAASFVILAVILWALFAAPNSGRRLPLPALAIFRAGMFLVAAFFIYRLAYKSMALIMGGLAVITQTISCFTEK
ncbi:MAG TPA: YrdB family protein [Puia sp.]